MKKTLEDEIKRIIEEKKENDVNSSFSILEKANEEYKKLVNAGLASPRGYNLMAINDVSISNYKIN